MNDKISSSSDPHQPTTVKYRLTLSDWAHALLPHVIPLYGIINGQWNLLTVLFVYWVEIVARTVITVIRIALSNGSLPMPEYQATDDTPARPRTKASVLFIALTLNLSCGVMGGFFALLALRLEYQQSIVFSPWLGLSILLSILPLVTKLFVFIKQKKYTQISPYWAQGSTVGHSLVLFASLFSIIFLQNSIFGYALGTLVFMATQVFASLTRVLLARTHTNAGSV